MTKIDISFSPSFLQLLWGCIRANLRYAFEAQLFITETILCFPTSHCSLKIILLSELYTTWLSTRTRTTPSATSSLTSSCLSRLSYTHGSNLFSQGMRQLLNSPLTLKYISYSGLHYLDFSTKIWRKVKSISYQYFKK